MIVAYWFFFEVFQKLFVLSIVNWLPIWKKSKIFPEYLFLLHLNVFRVAYEGLNFDISLKRILRLQKRDGLRNPRQKRAPRYSLRTEARIENLKMMTVLFDSSQFETTYVHLYLYAESPLIQNQNFLRILSSVSLSSVLRSGENFFKRIFHVPTAATFVRLLN